MSLDRLMSIPQAFAVSEGKERQIGIQGYAITKTYVDPLKMIEDRQFAEKKSTRPKKSLLKKGSYLDDEARLHKLVPGPGKYPFKDEWPQKSKKIKMKFKDRLTDIAELMQQEKKMKRPAPGHYKITKTLKELDKERKQMAHRKVKLPDRINYLDQVQYEAAQGPGVGNYNIRMRSKTQISHSKRREKPEEMRKKHAQEAKKNKPKKRPSSTTYNPKPSDYTLFSTMMTTSKNKNGFGKTARFKTAPSGSGLQPTRYSVVQKWRGKSDQKIQRHGLEVLSRGRMHTSVYY